jgi:hypothetical protein
MSSSPTFEWWPADRILIHERTDSVRVEKLARQMQRSGVCETPIYIDRATGVLLDGHHRYAALLRLGATRIPVWAVEYEDDSVISLERWRPGPPISRAEVVRRARAGEPFPPKTTRHILHVKLPAHPVRLSEALVAPADASTG